MNLGYIARTAMNFGVKRLYFVSPRANLKGKEARMYSKHGYPLLEGAKVYRSLTRRRRDCDLAARDKRHMGQGEGNFRQGLFAEDAVARLGKMRKDGTVGLLIGRDDIGLKREEVEKCDMLAYISTDPAYPVLNISHALAILLYLLKREGLREHHANSPRRRRSSTAGRSPSSWRSSTSW